MELKQIVGKGVKAGAGMGKNLQGIQKAITTVQK